MQNKPNFRKAKMNVNIYYTKAYKNETASGSGKNKPNSNPIKANCRKSKIDAKCVFTKDYSKKDDFAVRKNKPNSNPISVNPKMNVMFYSIKDYENESAFRPQKNKPKTKPKQTQFPKGQNERKIACRKIWPHPRKTPSHNLSKRLLALWDCAIIRTVKKATILTENIKII
jgi:hypothetical protein